MQLVAKPIFPCSQHHVEHDVAAVACRGTPCSFCACRCRVAISAPLTRHVAVAALHYPVRTQAGQRPPGMVVAALDWRAAVRL